LKKVWRLYNLITLGEFYRLPQNPEEPAELSKSFAGCFKSRKSKLNSPRVLQAASKSGRTSKLSKSFAGCFKIRKNKPKLSKSLALQEFVKLSKHILFPP
jgi:hypothetical protein